MPNGCPGDVRYWNIVEHFRKHIQCFSMSNEKIHQGKKPRYHENCTSHLDVMMCHLTHSLKGLLKVMPRACPDALSDVMAGSIVNHPIYTPKLEEE
jgi:hypothetical protein